MIFIYWCDFVYDIYIVQVNVCTDFEINRFRIDEENQLEVSTTSGSKVMAQIVVFVFSVTLTLTFDLCSIFLSHALRMMYWNIHAKFH